MCSLQRRPHDLHIADALERVVYAPLRLLHKHLPGTGAVRGTWHSLNPATMFTDSHRRLLCCSRAEEPSHPQLYACTWRLCAKAFPHLLDGFVEVLRVQALIDAPLLCKLELCRVDVNAVNVRCASLLRRLPTIVFSCGPHWYIVGRSAKRQPITK